MNQSQKCWAHRIPYIGWIGHGEFAFINWGWLWDHLYFPLTGLHFHFPPGPTGFHSFKSIRKKDFFFNSWIWIWDYDRVFSSLNLIIKFSFFNSQFLESELDWNFRPSI